MLFAFGAHHEQLDAHDADVIERLGDLGRDPFGFGRERRRHFRRHMRDVENVVAVLVLGHLEAFDFAVVAARGDHRHLALERDEAFQDARHAAQRPPRRVGVGSTHDLGLALAVVAERARLQHRRQADFGEAVGELGGTVHRRVGRGGDAELADEILLDQPVLGQFQHLRVRRDLLALAEERRGLGRDVLEFIGDDVDRIGEAGERVFVLVVGASKGVHHLEGAGVLLRRIDMAAQAERRGGERQHAGELSAAENPNGRAGFQQHTLRSFPRKRETRITIAESEILCSGSPLSRGRAERLIRSMLNLSAAWRRTWSAARATGRGAWRFQRPTAPGCWRRATRR